jgi:hypothetical protein
MPPWPPGQSGNPAGSSDKAQATAKLKKLLDLESFIKVGIAEAMKGSFAFWRYIFDRYDGQMPKAEQLASDMDELNQVLAELQAEHDRSEESVRGTTPMLEGPQSIP